MSSSVRRIAVFVSGGGTNLQSLLDAEQDKFFQSKICLVISNREDAYALERAKNYNVPAFVLKSENEILDKQVFASSLETNFIFVVSISSCKELACLSCSAAPLYDVIIIGANIFAFASFCALI